METIEHVLEVPKESKEVIDFALAIVKDVREGKEIADIVAGSLTGLVDAVGGYDKIPEEAKSEKLGELVAYATDQIADIFGK